MSHETRRLRDLAAALGREVEGDADVVVSGVASLEAAGPDDLAFVRSERYAPRLTDSRAGAVILPPGVDAGGRPAIRSSQPELDFARAVRLLVPEVKPPPGVHPAAEVAPDAKLDASVSLGAHVSIGAGCVVGRGSVLHANVTLDRDVEIGADCVIHPGCVLGPATRLGDRVILHPGVVIGGDGFGYAPDGNGGLAKLPQVGRVWLGDDVEIGANSTVDRGTLGETRIGDRVKIDNLVQIAHNCVIGDDAIIVSQAGLAGSSVVERGAIIMGQAGIAGHLTIGERAFVGPQTGVHRDVPAGGRVYGTPQQPARAWHRMVAAFVHLPRLIARVRELERRVGIRSEDVGDD